jgi:uncharacterized membrane protein
MNSLAIRRTFPSGMLLGIGLGGFLDGIVLRQLAQWHHMLSARLPPTTMELLRVNLAWDGAFHSVTWLITLAGVLTLFQQARQGDPLPSRRGFIGLLVLGGGVFNLVEGLAGHHILSLHHVRDLPAHVPLFDWLFLLIGGVGLILLGWALARDG